MTRQSMPLAAANDTADLVGRWRLLLWRNLAEDGTVVHYPARPTARAAACGDAQWSDPLSARWLSYLNERLDGLPVVVCQCGSGTR